MDRNRSLTKTQCELMEEAQRRGHVCVVTADGKGIRQWNALLGLIQLGMLERVKVGRATERGYTQDKRRRTIYYATLCARLVGGQQAR